MSINKNNKEEFIGQIIDLFEDFLDEKNVKISNPEAVEDGEENVAIIYRILSKKAHLFRGGMNCRADVCRLFLYKIDVRC